MATDPGLDTGLSPGLDPGLLRTQRWMQAFILAPGEDEEALRAEVVQAEVPADVALKMVLPSETLTPLERVGIYRGMYLARLEEALESDYPAVKHFLGEAGFSDLVAAYVDKHPSRSYTLNRLGDHFPAFVATQTGLPKHEFVRELARLELALSEVFDAEETPVLGVQAIAAIPPDAWENARFKPIAALRLMAFRYPVSAYLGGVDEENPFPRIRQRDNWVLAYRNQYSLCRDSLSRPAFELLNGLISGVPVGQALGSVAASHKKLFGWFRDWMSAGLFQSVEL
jgi:hypothetical protein